MQFNEYKFVDYEAENSTGMSLQRDSISHLYITKWTCFKYKLQNLL